MSKSMKSRARVVSSKLVYHGPVFKVFTDHVREPGGVQARRDVIRHPGSVVVLAVDDTRAEPRILLVRQYRYVAGKALWELPAGRIDEGEKALAAGKRELLEETGYSARRWKLALRFWPSPGFLDESMDIFLATGLRPGTAQPEEDEDIELRFFPLQAAVRQVMSGRMQDGKTIASVLWYARKFPTSTR